MGEAGADGWDVEELFKGMHAFYLCDADAYGWNIEADGYVGVGAGGTVGWFHSEPGNGGGGKLHEGVGLAELAGGTLAEDFYFCGQAGTGALCNDCSYLVGKVIEGGDVS